MNYIPVIAIGLLVGAAAKYVMPKKYLSLQMNVVVALVGAVLAAVLVQIAKPEDLDGLANLQILAAIGGALAAVLGGNWCFDLIAPDNPYHNPRIFKDEDDHSPKGPHSPEAWNR